MTKCWAGMATGGRWCATVGGPITGKVGAGARRSPQVEEAVVPIPEIPFVMLHIYVDKPRLANDEVVIHAMCAELWMGSQPIAMTQPQHTFGLPPRTVKEYARQLLEALY